MKYFRMICDYGRHRVVIFSLLFAGVLSGQADDLWAFEGAMLSPMTAGSNALLSQLEERRLDYIADRLAERAAERALRRAAKKADLIAEKKAERIAAKKAEMIAARKVELIAEKKITDRIETYIAKVKAADISPAKKEKLIKVQLQKIKEKKILAARRKEDLAREISLARLRKYEKLYDDHGAPAIGDELLILVEDKAALNVEAKDYQVKEQVYLAGLGLFMMRVSPPNGRTLTATATDINAVLDNGAAGFNHLFVPEFRTTGSQEISYSMTDISENLNLVPAHSAEIRIGLIDTLVDRSHAALQDEVIVMADFVPYDRERPESHGTAVASILVGNEQDKYQGVIPGARLFAASVFFKQPKGGTAATTDSLIFALDWLVRQNVQVINMSLSGPANQLLELAVRQVIKKGIIIVAAVGNGGPTAPLRYPAAYRDVVAVTAVDKARQVYWRANRGRHVVFSAPGVDIPTAHAGGGYQTRTGTSIAAPFVSAILANMVAENTLQERQGLVKILEKNAIDLGQKGFDNIYGYGFIQAVSQ